MHTNFLKYRTLFFILALLVTSNTIVFGQDSSDTNEKISELRNYIEWSTNYAHQKEFDSANKYTNRADTLVQTINDENWVALNNYNSSKVAYWQGRTDIATDIITSNFDNQELEDSVKIKSHFLYYEILSYKQNYDGAIAQLFTCEEILLERNKPSYLDSLAFESIYYAMGSIHKNYENSSAAIKYYNKALDFNVNDEYRTGILFAISEVYQKDSNLEYAIKYSLESVELAKLKKLDIFLPTAYALVSENYLKFGKPDSTIYYAKIGLKDNHDCQIDWLNSLMGEGLYEQGRYKESLKFFDTANEFSTTEEMMVSTEKNLSNSYAKLGQFDKALEHSNTHQKLKAEIDSRKVKQEIVEITERYESDKKEMKIEMLHTENTYNMDVISKQKSQLWLAGLLIALILAVLALIYYFYSQQKKHRYILYKKNLELAQKLKDRGQLSGISPIKVKNTKVDLDAKKMNSIKTSVVQMVTDEFYLEHDMTLSKMAKMIDTNTSYLSKVINEHYKTSFANFINDLRISYTLKSLETLPAFRNFTVDYIAEKSGFASSSAFYKSFKKNTGLTPSYYIKKRLQE